MSGDEFKKNLSKIHFAVHLWSLANWFERGCLCDIWLAATTPKGGMEGDAVLVVLQQLLQCMLVGFFAVALIGWSNIWKRCAFQCFS